MYKVLLAYILSLSSAQRYTDPFFSHQNNYEVKEEPNNNFFSSGNNLRFSLNQKFGDPTGFLNEGHFKTSLFEPFQKSIGNQGRLQQSSSFPRFTTFGSLGNFYQQQQQNYPSQYQGGFYQQPLAYNHKGFHNDENKKIADSLYKHEQGHQGIEGEAGIKQVNEGVLYRKGKEEKSALYANEEANKKVLEDSKKYDGNKLHEKEGSNENEEKNKSSHKKGHVIKHFKNSHHKDETGRDEQYYDEEHDEGGIFKFDSTKGKFGENESSHQKAVKENKELESSEKVHKGEHENRQFSGQNSEHLEGLKEEKKLLDASEHGKGNLHKEESILGHQETEKVLLKQPLHDGFDKDT